METNTITQADYTELCASLPDASKSLFNAFFYNIGSCVYIRLPKTQDFKPVLFEICILRPVNIDAFLLSFIKLTKFFRITVPIITVKLNNKFYGWYKSIHNKLVGNAILLNIFNLQTIKYGITRYFEFIGRQCLLFDIQIRKHVEEIRVSVTTFNATIFCRVMNDARSRDPKSIPASFASGFDFISTLPLVQTIKRTKPCFVYSVFRSIKFLVAFFALFVHTVSFWNRLACFRYTFVTTISSWAKEQFTALGTWLVFSFVGNSVLSWHNTTPLFSNIIPQITLTQKPVALFEYLIKTYTQAGDIVLDPFAGSGTTAVACIKTNRRYICGDQSAEYVELARKRIATCDPYQDTPVDDGVTQLSMFSTVAHDGE